MFLPLNKLIEYFRLLLFPFSGLFFIIISLRNLFYKTGIFKIIDVNIPVISIGNISTGGTGKTPLTILIANYFILKSKTVCIISRGYKRHSNEMTIVYNGKDLLVDAFNAVDELMMIYEKLRLFGNDFYIIASSDRLKAAVYAKNHFKADIIILDDAFQHRKIKRNLDIAVIDNTQHSISEKLLLPAGNLRETFSALKRADLVITNNKFSDEFTNTGNVLIKYVNCGFYNYKNEVIENNSQKVIAFCGIAKPDSFFDSLNNFDNLEEFSFNDHHNYTEQNIEMLISKYQNNSIFITTEKDFVKIKEFHYFIDNYPVYYLKIDLVIVKGKDKLEHKLNELLKI